MPRPLSARQGSAGRIGALATTLALTATLLVTSPASASEEPGPNEAPTHVAAGATNELTPSEPAPGDAAPAEQADETPDLVEQLDEQPELHEQPEEQHTDASADSEAPPPVLAAAVAFPTAFAFDRDVLSPGETVTGYFNGDPDLTSINIDACGVFGAPDLAPSPQLLERLEVVSDYAMLAAQFEPEAALWVAFYPATIVDGEPECEPWSPGMGIGDSFVLAAPVVVPGTPSETNEQLMCDWGSADSINYESSAATWWSVCMTDGSISDGETASKGDAFDGIGNVVLTGEYEGREWEYVVTADAATDYRYTPGHLRFTDNSIQIPGRSGLVDVTIDLRIVNSWASWTVFALEAGTATPAVIEMAMTGNLGSDSWTRWTDAGAGLISDDESAGYDPSVIHAGSIVANGTRHYEQDEDNYRFDTTASSFTYAVGLLDYCGTADEALPTATAIAADYRAHLGTSLATVLGENCIGANSPLINVRAGEPFDVTVPISLIGPWDLSAGIQADVDYDDLPSGVAFEILGEGTPGTAPSIRMHGQVDEVTTGQLNLRIDAGGSSEYIAVRFQSLDGTPAGATSPEVLTIDLGVEVGELVAGAPATFRGEGLQPGAAWNVVVRSTPIEIARGIVNPVGEFTVTASIPNASQLAAGWHSVTVSSTSTSGTAVSRVLYFQMAADGTLLAVSSTAPAEASVTPTATPTLQVTGAEPQATAWLAALLLALGLAFVAAPTAVRRIRRA